MEQFNNPAPTPKDATKATEEQPRLQEKLAHQSDVRTHRASRWGPARSGVIGSTANCVPRSSAAWVATAQLPTF